MREHLLCSSSSPFLEELGQIPHHESNNHHSWSVKVNFSCVNHQMGDSLNSDSIFYQEDTSANVSKRQKVSFHMPPLFCIVSNEDIPIRNVALNYDDKSLKKERESCT